MTHKILHNQVQAMGIGDALVDLNTYASQLPSRGGNIWSTAAKMTPGGTTANVATGIARLGIGSSFVGCVSSDPYGKYIIEELNKAGVETTGVFIKKDTYSGIVVEREQLIFNLKETMFPKLISVRPRLFTRLVCAWLKILPGQRF